MYNSGACDISRFTLFVFTNKYYTIYIYSANDSVSFLFFSVSDSVVAVEGLARVFRGVTKGTVGGLVAGNSGEE